MNKLIGIGVILLILVIAFSPYASSQISEEDSIQAEMRIDFFEEFPNQENLSRAALIDFPSTIYIAAKSLEEYNKSKEILFGINPNLEVGYWPFMNESIFVSPFCFTYELKNLIKEIENQENKTLKVLLDLELPWNKTQIITNLLSFPVNKRIIRQIFEKSDELNIEIYTAEYPAPSNITQKFFEFSGMSYSLDKYPHKMIVMYYSKMIGRKLPCFIKPIANFIIEKQIAYNSNKYGENFQVGIGLIAVGITGNESIKYIISPENLDADLSFLVSSSVKTAVIYRLGGLNESYLNVIKKYV